jgi:hypothetical protein
MRLDGPADQMQLGPRPGRPWATPIPIRYAGVPTISREAGWINPSTLWLGVPHRTQFDGTFYGPTNCGPTSLGMVFEAYGLMGYPSDAIRGEVNRISGDSNPDNGTSLGAISVVAQRAGLQPLDLYQGGGYKRWTLDAVRAHVQEGRPVITLTRYADLPGNAYYGSDINHYIVITGVSGDNFIYNDSAYSQGRGRGLLIAPDALQRAWANSTIPGHSVAFALNLAGDGLLSPMARARAAELQAEEDAAAAAEAQLVASEVRGLARAVQFDAPASASLIPENGLAGVTRSLVLSAQLDETSGLPKPSAALALLAGYTTVALGLVLPRLRKRSAR